MNEKYRMLIEKKIIKHVILLKRKINNIDNRNDGDDGVQVGHSQGQLSGRVSEGQSGVKVYGHGGKGEQVRGPLGLDRGFHYRPSDTCPLE